MQIPESTNVDPRNHHPGAEEVRRLREAADRLRATLPLSEAEVEQVVADFEARRRGRQQPVTLDSPVRTSNFMEI